jgi:hypothetical protein
MKKFWEIHKTNKKESREVAEKISKSLASASMLVQEAVKRVQSRLEKIYKTDGKWLSSGCLVASSRASMLTVELY